MDRIRAEMVIGLINQVHRGMAPNGGEYPVRWQWSVDDSVLVYLESGVPVSKDGDRLALLIAQHLLERHTKTPFVWCIYTEIRVSTYNLKGTLHARNPLDQQVDTLKRMEGEMAAFKQWLLKIHLRS